MSSPSDEPYIFPRDAEAIGAAFYAIADVMRKAPWGVAQVQHDLNMSLADLQELLHNVPVFETLSGVGLDGPITHTYPVTFVHCPADARIFDAYAPDFQLVTSGGGSVEQAEVGIKLQLASAIRLMLRDGEPLPAPGSRRFRLDRGGWRRWATNKGLLVLHAAVPVGVNVGDIWRP